MNTKRLSTIVISILLFTSLFMGNFSNAYAQAAPEDIVTFAAIGEKEILLDGPVDSTGIDFNIPAHWSLAPGAMLHLNLRAYVGENVTASSPSSVAAYIDLYMNDTWLQTIALNKNGDSSFDVEIPNTAWRAHETGLPQTLRISLHDAVRCSLVWASAGNGTWRGINVAIEPTSYLYLPHQIIPMSTDLRQLPYPIYQNSFGPDKAVVVVPDQPTESELQAALVVEAALARITGGNLVTTFSTVSALNPANVVGAHAIFVGRPSAFPQLLPSMLPLAADGDVFQGQLIQPGDGILELVPSPADLSKVWLLVSGNDGEGMVKAAQAVGSGVIRPYGPSNLAIVRSVQPQPAAIAPNTDFTLANLGYGEEKYSGYGLAYFSYYFDISPTQIVSEGAYFELIYNNSALMNFEESGISIILNDRFVGSVRFNDRTTDASSAQFNIPTSNFQAGRNSLLLEANLAGMTPCIPLDEIWISIKPESLFHIPTLPASDTEIPSYDLALYPQRLFPTFDNLAFILQRDNPTSWNIAATMAYEIGINSRNAVAKPSVAFADAIPAGLREGNNQIIVGQASKLPIIQDLAQVMPASFEAGADIAAEDKSEFTFHVPATTPVGYLQVMPSPWNNKQVILAVLGNGDAGLQSASTALATNTIRSQMAGNLVVTYNNQVIVNNIPMAPAATAATPTVLLPPTPVASGTQTGPFKVNIVNIGLGILAVLVILGLVALIVRSKKKKPAK